MAAGHPNSFTSQSLARFADRHYKEIKRVGNHLIPYKIWELYEVITRSLEILSSEPSLLEIAAPITIVGDIHGQFNDLIRIFNTMGLPPSRRYLFLGDYVDRGQMSLECIVLLLTYKILYPQHVYLIRGNHECKKINEVYGFCAQMEKRFGGRRLWKRFQDPFNNLPLAAVVNNKMLCVHGGISSHLNSLDRIRKIRKPVEQEAIQPVGALPNLINDLLWADPEVGISGYRPSPRGTSFLFGAEALRTCMEKLGIEIVVRAHQVCQDGYRFFDNKRLITIFSAPNYCSEAFNMGTVLSITDTLICSFTSFRAPPSITTISSKSH